MRGEFTKCAHQFLRMKISLCARRFLRQRCLYAVDRKSHGCWTWRSCSLWLAVTLQGSSPLRFLDHSIRSGDSLVGLSRAQVQY